MKLQTHKVSVMKCTLNDQDIFVLTEAQIKVFKHLIPEDELETHLKGLILYVVSQKLRECVSKLFEEWKPKLAEEGVKQIPLSDAELAEMIISRDDYVSSAVSRSGIEVTE